MSAVKGIVLTVVVAAVAVGEAPAGPQLEVASIRPSANSDEIQQGKVAVGLHMDGSQVHVASFTVKDYLGIAYRMKIAQISGPDWISSERFDVSATIPEGGKTSEIPEMFQALLAQRFQLKFHREQREFPVYALLPGKGPLKLKEVPRDPNDGATAAPIDMKGGGSINGVNINYGNGSTFSLVPNTVEVHKLSMGDFARIIERFTDRTVVDMTGLRGQYDFRVDINSEDYLPMLIHSAMNAGVTSLPPEAIKIAEGHTAAGLSDALQTIGLKLEARKAPLDVIVVDSGAKTPTEN